MEANAAEGEEFLREMLAMDEGARRLGEFAFGMNDSVQEFTGHTLFDEKLGVIVVHMALGKAYPESGGKNESALHGTSSATSEARAKFTRTASSSIGTASSCPICSDRSSGDTHLPRGARSLPADCLRILEAADAIVHTGDFTASSVLVDLERLGPVVAVQGNMDDGELRAALPVRTTAELEGLCGKEPRNDCASPAVVAPDGNRRTTKALIDVNFRATPARCPLFGQRQDRTRGAQVVLVHHHPHRDQQPAAVGDAGPAVEGNRAMPSLSSRPTRILARLRS